MGKKALEFNAKDAQSLQFVLERAQKLGFIGKNSDISEEIKHSWHFGEIAFESLLTSHSALLCWDMGSGGGLPALSLSARWREPNWVLNDVSAKKCDFLEWAVIRLGLNAVVHNGPVETAARMPQHKEHYNLVTSRAFADIERAADCANGLLAQSGYLLVSNSPHGRRWPEKVLKKFHLEETPSVSVLKKK